MSNFKIIKQKILEELIHKGVFDYDMRKCIKYPCLLEHKNPNLNSFISVLHTFIYSKGFKNAFTLYLQTVYEKMIHRLEIDEIKKIYQELKSTNKIPSVISTNKKVKTLLTIMDLLCHKNGITPKQVETLFSYLSFTMKSYPIIDLVQWIDMLGVPYAIHYLHKETIKPKKGKNPVVCILQNIMEQKIPLQYKPDVVIWGSYYPNITSPYKSIINNYKELPPILPKDPSYVLESCVIAVEFIKKSNNPLIEMGKIIKRETIGDSMFHFSTAYLCNLDKNPTFWIADSKTVAPQYMHLPWLYLNHLKTYRYYLDVYESLLTNHYGNDIEIVDIHYAYATYVRNDLLSVKFKLGDCSLIH